MTPLSDKRWAQNRSTSPRTGLPRQRRVFREQGQKRVLERIESDFNGDGRVNFVQIFDSSGTWVTKEKSDLSGNGLFDVIALYRWDSSRNSPRLYEEHFDTNYDGQIDLWKEYNPQGQLTLRRLDRNGNGRADYWEHYDQQRLVRVQEDRSGDGKPDPSPVPRIRRR